MLGGVLWVLAGSTAIPGAPASSVFFGTAFFGIAEGCTADGESADLTEGPVDGGLRTLLVPDEVLPVFAGAGAGDPATPLLPVVAGLGGLARPCGFETTPLGCFTSVLD